MDRFGIEEDEPIEHKLITRAIENAQGRVEGHNFEIRKHLLEYDDVMNKQREIIYELRNRALHDASLSDLVQEYIELLAGSIIDEFFAKGIPHDEIDLKGFREAIFLQFSTVLFLTPEQLAKFKDNELIGIPIRIVVGSKGLVEGKVEVKIRSTGEVQSILVEEVTASVKQMIDAALTQQ